MIETIDELVAESITELRHVVNHLRATSSAAVADELEKSVNKIEQDFCKTAIGMDRPNFVMIEPPNGEHLASTKRHMVKVAEELILAAFPHLNQISELLMPGYKYPFASAGSASSDFLSLNPPTTDGPYSSGGFLAKAIAEMKKHHGLMETEGLGLSGAAQLPMPRADTEHISAVQKAFDRIRLDEAATLKDAFNGDSLKTGESMPLKVPERKRGIVGLCEVYGKMEDSHVRPVSVAGGSVPSSAAPRFVPMNPVWNDDMIKISGGYRVVARATPTQNGSQGPGKADFRSSGSTDALVKKAIHNVNSNVQFLQGAAQRRSGKAPGAFRINDPVGIRGRANSVGPSSVGPSRIRIDQSPAGSLSEWLHLLGPSTLAPKKEPPRTLDATPRQNVPSAFDSTPREVITRIPCPHPGTNVPRTPESKIVVGYQRPCVVRSSHTAQELEEHSAWVYITGPFHPNTKPFTAHCLNWLTLRVHEGPIFTMRVSHTHSCAALLFYLASDAKYFVDKEAERLALTGVTRFGPLYNVHFGAIHDWSPMLHRMGMPHRERRRLTFARAALFSPELSPKKWEIDVMAVVDRENIDFLWVFNSGNATAVFRDIESARTVREHFMKVSKKNHPSNPYREVQVTFSQDPCERPLALKTQLRDGMAPPLQLRMEQARRELAEDTEDWAL